MYADRRFYEKNTFLITGGTGFIGSNLSKHLSDNNAGKVIILDNLENSAIENISEILPRKNVEFVKGDIRDTSILTDLVKESNYISHQAALGSVPRSINDPLTSNDVNISGSLNLLQVISENSSRFKRLVYAGSSSTYGDSTELPKIEERIGNPLSPYAVTKFTNELYAKVFAELYDLQIIGLRYFNVFGPNQSPTNPYAAVIPIFINAALNDTPPVINGDGKTTRDFTYIENVIQANIKALSSNKIKLNHDVFNVSCGNQISLNELWKEICELTNKEINPIYGEERKGDVKHSKANIDKAKMYLEYSPTVEIREGLSKTINLYFNQS